MDTRLNIEVRVIARDAIAQIQMLEKQTAAYEAAIAKASLAGKTSSSTGFFASLKQQVSGAATAFTQAENTAGRFAAIGNGVKGVWSSMTSGIAGAVGRLENFNTGLTNAGKNLQWAGRQIEYRFSLPLLAAGALATKWAFDNERAFTQLTRVYTDLNGSGAKVQGTLKLLQQAFVDLSNIYGISQSDIISIGTEWAKLGASGGALAKAVDLTAQAMILGNVSAQDAVAGLTNLRQVYGLTITDLGKAVDTINAIANRSRIGFDDMFTAVQRGAATARGAGVDIQHFAALVATLAPATGDASVAGRSLQTIFSRLFTPTKASAEVMKLMGINVYSASFQAKNGTDRLNEMAQAFGKLTPAQKLFTSTTIASRFQVGRFTELMNDLNDKTGTYNRLVKGSSDASKNSAEATRDISKILSSQPQAFTIAMNEIKNSLAKAIVPLLPVIVGFVQKIAQLVDAFTHLSPKTQEFILWLGVALALAGPVTSTLGAFGVLIGIIGKTALGAVKGVGGLMKVFGLISKTKAPSIGLEKTIGDAAASGTDAGTAYVEGAAGAVEETQASIITAATSLWGIVATQTAAAADAAGEGAAMAYSTAVLASLGSFGGETIATETASIFALAASGIDAVAATAGEGAAVAYVGGIGSGMAASGGIFDAAAVADMTAAAPTVLAAAFGLGETAGVAFDAGVAAGMAQGVEVKAAAGIADFEAAAPAIVSAAAEVGAAAGIALDVGAAAAIGSGGALIAGSAAALAAGAAEALAGGLVDVGAGLGAELIGGATAALESGAAALGNEVILGLTTAVEDGVTYIAEILPAIGGELSGLLGDVGAEAGGGLVAGVVGTLEALPTGVTQIIGLVIAAVAIGFTLMNRNIRNLLGDGINAVGTAIMELPRVVGNALMGVLRVVMDIGKAIWQALQDFLNPFQRHSPSLVDLVTSGVDIIAQKYRSLRSISSDLQAAISDMKKFKEETKGINDTVDQLKFNDQRAKIVKVHPELGAVADSTFANEKVLKGDLDDVTAAYARQQIVVDKWQRQLDKANDALDQQQYILGQEQSHLDALSSKLDNAKNHLDKVSNAPLRGEKAAQEAIYQNELATKKWELALTKLENTYGTLDQIKQKVSNINGELELLKGSEQNLRFKGAGSEILGPLEKQEQALRGQQTALGDVATKMTNYQTNIDKLTLSGQQMQLQFDTTFGDMHHQIERIANDAHSISFKDAMDGAKRWKPVVDQLSFSYDKQNQKVKAQEGIVRNLTNTRDQLQHSYDKENKTLTALGKVYDAINQQISDLDSSLSGLASSAQTISDTIADGFGAAGAGKFDTSKLLKGIPKEGDLDKLLKEYEKRIKKSFGNLKLGDIFTGPFKAAWHKFQDWWTQTAWPWLQKIPGDVTGFFTNTNNWRQAGDIFSAPFKFGWDQLTKWWSTTAAPWLSSLPDKIGGLLSGVPHAVGDALKSVGSAILEPFKAAWKSLGGGKGSIPFQIGHMIAEFALLPIKLPLALGKLGLILMKWTSQGVSYLIDHLPSIWGAILRWFSGVPQMLLNALDASIHLGAHLQGWLGGVAFNLLTHLPGIFGGILTWFSNLPSKIAHAMGDVAGALIDVFKGAWNGLADWWNQNISAHSIHIPQIGFGKFKTPGGDISLPSLPEFKLAAGGVASATPGGIDVRIAEAGRNELVAPLPPGFSMGRMDATINRLEHYIDNHGQQTTMQPVINNQKTVHIHGDLSFPNIREGSDAKKLITNLEALAK